MGTALTVSTDQNHHPDIIPPELPEISVLMSVYNAEKYIGQAVESILNQTYSNLEFVIVEDGSTDQSFNILQRYADRDSRILLIQNRENIGVVHALNLGLARVRGNYIARQDADDYSFPERLKQQLAYLESNPDCGAVGTCGLYIDPDGNSGGVINNPSSNEEIQRVLLDHMCFIGPTIMIRRDTLDAAGYYFSEGLDASEDYDLCLRLAEVANVGNLEGIYYGYRQHPGSASSQRRYKQMFNKALALERAGDRRYDSDPPAEFVSLVARDYLRAAVLAYRNNEYSFARQSLSKACGLDPSVLKNAKQIKSVVHKYTPTESVKDALIYTESVFRDLFPPTIPIKRVKSKLISQLHMGEVFSSMNRGDTGELEYHLWRGIRYDPTWLLNPGVVSVLLKSMFFRNRLN